MKEVTENWTQNFRSMEVGEQVQCPARNYGVINATINRLEIEGLDGEVQYSIKTERDKKIIIVTRTA